jgi:adenylate cyclase
MTPLSRMLRSERTVALLAALLATAAILGVRQVGWLEPVELLVYDQLLARRPVTPGAGDDLIVVGYSETDIMEMATYPINDEEMTRLLKTILDFAPRAVGVDFHRDVLIPPGSDELEALLQSDPRIVMVYKLSDEGTPGIPPPKVLAGTNQIGLSDLMIDPDELVRRALLYAQDETGGVHLSLALQVALRWLHAEGAGQFGSDPEAPEHVRLGATTVPNLRKDDGGYTSVDMDGFQFLIDYNGHARYRTVTVMDIFKGRVSAEDFRDKMVFVGATAESIADLRRSPFGYWPGIYIHTHIAEQLARYGMGLGSPRSTWSTSQERAWVLAWALLGAGLALKRGSLAVFVATTTIGSVAIAALGVAMLVKGTWIPVAPPLASWLLAAGGVTAYISRREAADRKVMMQLFSRNVSRTVAAYMWENRDQFMEGGRPRPQRQHVTVLFVDVKSFTPVAESLDPIGLMDWVNELMGVLAREVEEHGGFVDDYFGDGMKADFGVPVPHESEEQWCEDAVTAVECALSMERNLAALNESWIERGMPIGRLRVGIDSGFAVVGNVGSSDRMKYTVLGDTANTAARIESLADDNHDFEERPVRILASHRAAALLGDQFETFDHGEVELKGKTQKIRAIEILYTRSDPNPATSSAARV